MGLMATGLGPSAASLRASSIWQAQSNQQLRVVEAPHFVRILYKGSGGLHDSASQGGAADRASGEWYTFGRDGGTPFGAHIIRRGKRAGLALGVCRTGSPRRRAPSRRASRLAWTRRQAPAPLGSDFLATRRERLPHAIKTAWRQPASLVQVLHGHGILDSMFSFPPLDLSIRPATAREREKERDGERKRHGQPGATHPTRPDHAAPPAPARPTRPRRPKTTRPARPEPLERPAPPRPTSVAPVMHLHRATPAWRLVAHTLPEIRGRRVRGPRLRQNRGVHKIKRIRRGGTRAILGIPPPEGHTP